MCFKCGEKWHGNTKCVEAQKINDGDFLDWAKSKDGSVMNCPKCSARIEKLPGGCNHLTCK